MKIEGSDGLYGALRELPVGSLKPGYILNDAQHAAIQTAMKLGQAVLLVWDEDSGTYWFGAFDIDGTDK